MTSNANIPTAEAIPVSTTQMVEVLAPANLAEGYTFQAIFDGNTFTVTVPQGGVKGGQKMVVPFTSPSPASESTPLVTGFGADTTVPRGAWKDGLCDCCKFSILHPSFLNALCCPQLLMAQVATRLRLNMLAVPAAESEWRMTFKRMLVLVMTYYILASLLAPPGPAYIYDSHEDKMVPNPEDVPVWQRVLYNFLTACWGIYSLIFLMRLRATVRRRYEIPEARCHGCEDLCCAFCCGCCTVAQLARQTADYHERRAVCCSDNGLPPASVVMVV